MGKIICAKCCIKTSKNFCVILLIDKAAQFRLKRYETAPLKRNAAGRNRRIKEGKQLILSNHHKLKYYT
jgi:hypothetical protein